MNGPSFDPDRHDSQLVAAFERRELAERAREALLAAGLPAHAVELVGAAAAADAEGFWGAIRRLFAPAEDAHQLGEAMRLGHVVVVVHANGIADRDKALAVLEGCQPLELEERDTSGLPELNHASLSRADLIATAPLRPPVPAAPSAPEPASTGATYTYGFPASVAQDLTAEEQVLAQAGDPGSRQEFVRIVEERLRVGWRDRTGGPTRTRRYVADRDPEAQRVELREEQIPAAPPRTP